MTVNERIQEIYSQISEGIYDKEIEIKLALLATLAGESILLLGPPGVAKSMVARQIKAAFKDARSFDYLMSRFSTPDEVFGPVSISHLKESDTYERNVDGYLPTADVVFLDEIWKAGPAIQNSLLTVINEKLFRNGDKEMRLPLKLLIAASNELPAQGEGLEALWDRFLIRVVCRCIKDEQAFYDMLLDSAVPARRIAKPITQKEYETWRKAIEQVTITPDVLHTISIIREGLKGVVVPNSDVKRNVYVSDRRWKKIIRLVKASAFMQGRDAADVTDLYVIQHCLWNNPEEIGDIRQIVLSAITKTSMQKVDQLQNDLQNDLRQRSLQRAIANLTLDNTDANLKFVDGFYFQVRNHGTGHTLVFAHDFLTLSCERNKPEQGVMFADQANPGNTIIHKLGDQGIGTLKEVERVSLYRDAYNIYINGRAYELERAETVAHRPAHDFSFTGHDYEQEVETLTEELGSAESHLRNNLFISADDAKEAGTFFNRILKRIAHMRIDIEHFLYE